MKGTAAVTWAATASLVVALAACSSNAPDLPDYTGTTADSTPSTSPSTTPSTTPSTPSSAAPSTTAKPSTPGGLPTAATIVHDPLPSSLPPAAKPVADAWFAYWDYLGVALTNPAAANAIDGVGAVASGAAARDVVAQLTALRDAKQHVVGPTKIQVRSGSVTGTQGSVCSFVTDLSSTLDAKGSITEPAQLRQIYFRAVLTKDGPRWRVSEISRPQSC